MEAIRPFECAICPHCQFDGERICVGGKKPRRFRSGDPKRKPPDWCPKRKRPCELRVYGFKSERDRIMHDLMSESQGGHSVPEARRYAVTLESHTGLTAAEFWKRCQSECPEDVLSVKVPLYGVVEIDDGLRPICFYNAGREYGILAAFDATAARKSRMEN